MVVLYFQISEGRAEQSFLQELHGQMYVYVLDSMLVVRGVGSLSPPAASYVYICIMYSVRGVSPQSSTDD